MDISQRVLSFLQDFKTKMSIWGVIFRDDRGKNMQCLLELDITPLNRNEILKGLELEDYSEGPLGEKLYGGAEMWVFGKMIKQKEVYIKITMGVNGTSVICISFHLAAHHMNYPFKTNSI
ncbi:type II toxin-antitoxin system MqsR family toxin [Chitinophaga sp. CF418]|uniref:type II toxin-antitoxin system MqsR family toxin n=1 Tax=Chitinophaga sp. CF418 TaxID=1855287 RepID=UPI00091DEFA4|nr:type II toxin-antitoxin system MqsR family toxin [Chitinophaga sp. CF418]SHM22449.1 hypothetical protein SAMN05216311_101894 [Chitinophaga sp. CF418]